MASVQRLALIAWGNCVEHDFLLPIGLTLEDFRRSFTGSWHFGYVQALREAGIETTSFVFSCCRREPESFVHEPSGSRFRLLPAPLPYRWWRRRHERSRDRVLGDYAATPLLKLGRAIRDERCTALLVQGHDYPRFDALVLLGQLLDLPVYTTYQGGADLRRGPVLDRLRRWSFARAAGLIVPSELELARIQLRYDIDPTRVARILNPIDVRFWCPQDKQAARARLGLSSTDVVVAWHGRVDVRQKGLDILIDAWKRVTAHAARPVMLHLLGSGPDRRDLEQLLSGVNAVRWVDRFVNAREDIREFLSAADLYVFPSRAEGLAVAPVEAMACGLPVVASRATPGIEELFPEGDEDETRLIERIEPEPLAGSILSLLHDDDLRAALSGRARARVRAMSLQAIGAQLTAVLTAGRTGLPSAEVPSGRRVPGQPLRIVELQPHASHMGESFNQQPDGESALLVHAEHATRATVIVFDGVVLPTAFGHSGLLSAVIPIALLRQVRSCPVRLTDGVRWSDAVSFEVLRSHG